MRRRMAASFKRVLGVRTWTVWKAGSSLSLTATGRLLKAVTSHRTPRSGFRVSRFADHFFKFAVVYFAGVLVRNLAYGLDFAGDGEIAQAFCFDGRADFVQRQ